jgi:hypothetical protein
MIAAVISSGIILGIIDTRIILKEEKSNAIRREIRTMAINTLSKRLRIRKLVPLA